MFPSLTATVSAGRLRLVPARVSDAARVLEAIQPSTLGNLSFFAEPLSLERQREYLARMEADPKDHLYLIEEEGGRLIGSIGFHEFDHANRSARLGCIVFRPEDRGNGYGTEAIKLVLLVGFTVAGLNKINIQFFPERLPRVEAYWKGLGFSVEGTLRDEYLLKGEWHDMIRMSALKRDWEALASAA